MLKITLFLYFTAILLLSCTNHDKISSKETAEITLVPRIGKTISGDFDGDGQVETVTSIKTKAGTGNPADGGTPDEYSIKFSNEKLANIPIGCCDVFFIGEGDLNNDGKDEFTVFQSPVNLCSQFVQTFSFKDGSMKLLIEPFIFAVGCVVGLSESEYFNIISLENGHIYYRVPDPADENLLNEAGDAVRFERLLKKEARLK